MEFTTAKRRTKPITFTIDGEEYNFHPPKQAVLILEVLDSDATEVHQAKALFDWLGEGLGEQQADALIGRLRDPADDLDWPDLLAVAQWLQEQVTGRPTT